MKISYESLVILRESLPRGSVKKIRDRLLKKNVRFSEQYIYRCLDPDQSAYNSLIIDEAILFCEESKKTIEQREERVFHLNHSEK